MGINLEGISDNQRRQKPVILMLDVSGSMTQDGKIDQLNRGIRGLISDFRDNDSLNADLRLCIITFGGDGAKIYQEYKPLNEVQWRDLNASGGTPLADALRLAKSVVEDREKLPPNAYRPVIILISDGMPYPPDDSESVMDEFISTGRTAKCDRFSCSVMNSDLTLLKKFVKDPSTHMMKAENARELLEYLRFMSSTICTSSKSADPNKVPTPNLEETVKAQAKSEDDNDWGFLDMFDD